MLSTTRSRALLAAVITVLLIAALILYILYGEKKPQPTFKNTTNLSQKNSPLQEFEGSGEAPTDSTDLQAQIPLISDDEENISTTTNLPTTTSTEPATTTAFVPIDDKTKAGLSECSSILREDRPKCEIEK